MPGGEGCQDQIDSRLPGPQLHEWGRGTGKARAGHPGTGYRGFRTKARPGTTTSGAGLSRHVRIIQKARPPVAPVTTPAYLITSCSGGMLTRAPWPLNSAVTV